MGLSIPSGGQISAEAWEIFLDTCVTPRFPAGLTVLTTNGQWQDLQTKRVDKEPGRVLVLVYPRTEKKPAHGQIEAIRRAYMSAFQQQAVMRVDQRVRVRF